MATAKKPAAKKAAPKKAAAKKTTPTPLQKKAKSTGAAPEKMYSMPPEVKEWIERAQSTINHLRGKVARLEQENAELKAYRKWAESKFTQA